MDAHGRIRGINPFLTWLYENDLISENLKIKKPKLEQKVMKNFTDSQISAIINYKPKDKYELRLHNLLLLLLDTGVRINEALTITRNSIDFENLLITVLGVKENWKLDNSIQSKIIAMAFSMAAEIERDLISSRTTEALRHRQAQGMKLGRPTGQGKSKFDQYRVEIKALLSNGSSQRFIAKRYNTTEANFSNWMKKNNITSKKHV